jgi:RHS repeat-associated protein
VAAVGPVARQRYLPYGARRGGDAIAATDHGYLGKVEDPTTSLIALDNREHDPSIGKLTSPDPLLVTEDPTSQNAYAYANNNPATLSDPSGLMPDCGTNRECWNGYAKGRQKAADKYNRLVKKKYTIKKPGRKARKNWRNCTGVECRYPGLKPRRRVGFMTNCGVFTCSAYLSRNSTRWLADHPEWLNGAHLAAASGCSMLPVPHQGVKAGCALVVGLNWSVMSANINRAAKAVNGQSKCFKITWGRQVPSVYYSTNNGLFCTD